MRGGTGETCSMRLSPNSSLTPDLKFFCSTWLYFNSIYPSSSNSFHSKAIKFNSDLKIDFISKHCIFNDSAIISPPRTTFREGQKQLFSQAETRTCVLVQPHTYSILWKNQQILLEWTEFLQADPRRLQKPICSDTFVDDWELNDWSSE